MTNPPLVCSCWRRYGYCPDPCPEVDDSAQVISLRRWLRVLGLAAAIYAALFAVVLWWVS